MNACIVCSRRILVEYFGVMYVEYVRLCLHTTSDVFLTPCKGASFTINAYVFSHPLIIIQIFSLQPVSVLLSYCTADI